jgi:trans-2,3-dihydro-3-hydroxyanthranilate isomerase
MDAVKRSGAKGTPYFEWLNRTDTKGVLVFSRETYKKESGLNARVFADGYGVPEDPATGSANGCLAAYLARHRYFGTETVEVRVEQGYEIGRQSLLLLKSGDRGDEVDVSVGGRVVLVAKGNLV